MKKSIAGFLLAAFLVLSSCQGGKNNAATEYNIIPLPNELTAQSGKFILQGETTVSVPSDSLSTNVFHYLQDALKNTAIALKQVSEGEKASISFVTDNSLPNEAYVLNVSPDKIILWRSVFIAIDACRNI